MDKAWKRQAAAAVAALVLLFGAAGAKSAAVIMSGTPKAEAKQEEKAAVAEWATVVMTAPTHEGPGLRYAMTGSIQRGRAVEIVRELDGYAKCLVYDAAPVWICMEYLEVAP